ncbi:chromate transporter [Gottfriedia acidiceleris]|uniref:Chromate transporter n=1 Tax=Gottfriedia acidiceleris TaxID=371036 RepID=A0ABY4JL59_9BACI|nr:chromate transporter [Gottfriedia acidiceleris]UPM53800.1 chromate transporter [Gottfriedia acidiceleris]
MNPNHKNSKLSILLEILFVSTKLGLTSFGGPIAHLGYFREEYVRKKKWIDDQNYADLVALSQFLPGPASSQVGIGIGLIRAGFLGGIVSFIGFTLPSVIALILFALLLQDLEIKNSSWIHGLKLVAVPIVAQAILGMVKNLTPDLKRKVLALFAMTATLIWQTTFTQIAVILISSIVGYFLYQDNENDDKTTLITNISKMVSIICLSIFFILLVLLPLFSSFTSSKWISIFDSFYRAGSMVFGGGHVVLPLLEREFVPTGWLNKETFLAGYGVTQAVPGPLFTFASYLGTVMMGWRGGLIATIAIFLPAFLLIIGTLPFWSSMRRSSKLRRALLGVNAAVVGILISAFCNPIWINSVFSIYDFLTVTVLFSMLVIMKLPPWVIVLVGAISGEIISRI